MQEITHNRRDNGRDDRGLLSALLGDGRPLLLLSGLALILAGGFALFLSASKHFLPHDVDYLGMTAEQLCGINNCRVVYFMFHDRVAFGGALIAIGVLYMWLAEFPLRRGEAVTWKTVRFRTVGDIISTAAIESAASTVSEIIDEIAATRITERGARADDRRSETAMEDRKREGYF